MKQGGGDTISGTVNRCAARGCQTSVSGAHGPIFAFHNFSIRSPRYGTCTIGFYALDYPHTTSYDARNDHLPFPIPSLALYHLLAQYRLLFQLPRLRYSTTSLATRSHINPHSSFTISYDGLMVSIHYSTTSTTRPAANFVSTPICQSYLSSGAVSAPLLSLIPYRSRIIPDTFLSPFRCRLRIPAESGDRA